MKRSRIAALAKVLRMKPSEIVMGKSCDASSFIDSEEQSDIDKEFAKLLSAMSEEEKEWLLNVIKSVIEGRK